MVKVDNNGEVYCDKMGVKVEQCLQYLDVSTRCEDCPMANIVQRIIKHF